MSAVDAIAIAVIIGVAIPLIYHRLRYGSAEQRSLRAIEKSESHPDNIAMLQKLLDDIRDTTDPGLIKDFEASMKIRREHTKKYWP